MFDIRKFLPTFVMLLNNVVKDIFVLFGKSSREEGLSTSNIMQMHTSVMNMDAIVSSILHNYRVTHIVSLVDAELRLWLHRRSTS